MKRVVKKLVQVPVAAASAFMWRVRREPELLILMYHRVLPRNHPDRSVEQPGMYVSPETLAMHLGLLRQHFTLIHLDDWIDAANRGAPLPRNACAITFDDGWLDNYEHAFPLLKLHHAPATVFVVSDLVGTRYAFWPNILARRLVTNAAAGWGQTPKWVRDLVPVHLRNGTLERTHIDEVIDRCKDVYSDAEMFERLGEWGEQASSGIVAVDRDLMSWDEVREMQASGLVKFGSHTRRHLRLAGKHSQTTLEDEVLGSSQQIREHLGMAPATFCYPNGDTSAEAIACVRNHYSAAVTTSPGWNQLTTDRFLLNRIGMHDDVSGSRSAFIARLSGVG